jgi:hypothetical protein
MRSIENIKKDYTETCITLGDLQVQKARIENAILDAMNKANELQKEFAERNKLEEELKKVRDENT